MTVLDGLIPLACESGIENTHLTEGTRAYEFLDYPYRDSAVEQFRTAFAVTANLPVSVVSRALSSSIPVSFFDDFYNRVHLRPQSLDLGYVITAQTSTVDVWNANLTAVNLTGISGASDGISVTGLTSFPVSFGAIQLAEYTVSITRDGPSTIDDYVTWTFSLTNDPVLHITGTRALAWNFPPNWGQSITERLSWLTDVLRAEDGSEQRIGLRQNPRLQYSFAFEVDGNLRRQFENKLQDLGAAAWALPVWPDVSQLATTVNAGALTIPVSTANKDYVADGLVILLSPDGLSYEAAQISTVAADSLTLKRAIENTWDTTTLIYPARIARMPDPAKLRRLTKGYITGEVTFEAVDGVGRTYTAETPTYRSHPVLEHEPNWRDGVPFSFERQLAVFDALTGPQHVVDRSQVAEPKQEKTWTAFGRTEVEALRKFLYARAGRHKGIWVPTFTPDLVPVAPIGSSDTSWNIEACGAASHTPRATRQDIRVELKSGTVYYRRVTATATINATTEAIIIDTAFGVTIEAEDVAQISWMSFTRLDSDEVELEWASSQVVETKLTLASPRHDV